MYEYVVALSHMVIYKTVGLLEVRSHSVGRNIKRVDDLMTDTVLFGIIDVQHGCGCED